MPTYFTTQFEFARTESDGLARRFYDGLTLAGAPFQKVFAWGCPADLTLEDIIVWNQTKLAAGFELGFCQDVSQDYRQILVDLPPYGTARVFVLLTPSGIAFHLIVPEQTVDRHGGSALRDLAEALWHRTNPRSIQTHGEAGAATAHEALGKGKTPAVELFAFLDEVYPVRELPGVAVEKLARGHLLTPR